MLTAAGFKVYEAQSRAAIIGIARQEDVDLVVMDLSLARERLDELLSQLGSGAHAPRLIAVTGRSPADEPFAARFDSYLVKPVLPDDLVAAVRATLSR